MDIWDLTYRFFSLADANVRWVVAGSMLLGGAAGGLGSFAFLQKRSLLGDALAHAALPGVGLAFLLAGRKDFLLLLLGAATTGWIGSLLVNAIVRHTKIKLDAALGIILTSFFGLGIVFLTAIQKSGSGAQAGLDKFLFGQAAAMGKNDVIVLAILGLVLLTVITIGFRRFTLITFDPDFARAAGLKVGWLQFVLTTMIVCAVTIGLQAVGVVLMAAMLITPAAAARQWTDRLPLMVALASLFGILSGVLGAYVSFLAPRFPTGPWMVVAVSAVFAFSILLAPRRGVISRVRTHLNNRRTMTRDHVLKVLFKAGQESRRWAASYPFEKISQMWSFAPRDLRRGLRSLNRQGLLKKDGRTFGLTDLGVGEGARVLRRHRLWEVYLTRFLELPEDHVHRDAEDMEQVLTPEMEELLEKLLDHPEYDPHRQEIPYVNPKEQA
ncbi:MAG TPA: metal ABC transporter permease [Candidatus Deferrimicrobium sp.]|nr:metal ABC transporter permease [Candidatus Deferrimicrobium sp.]